MDIDAGERLVMRINADLMKWDYLGLFIHENSSGIFAVCPKSEAQRSYHAYESPHLGSRSVEEDSSIKIR
jgi:hypothetical protein